MFQQPPKKDSPFTGSASKSGSSGKFMAHLLGLDQEQAMHQRSQTASPDNAGQPLNGARFAQLFNSFRFTTKSMFLLLFVGLFLWLFVVYFVRHQDPMAGEASTKSGAPERSRETDKQPVESAGTAVPVNNPAASGPIYVPVTPPATPDQGQIPVQTGVTPSPFTGGSPAVLSSPASSVMPYGTPQDGNLGSVEQPASAVQGRQGKYYVQTNARARVKTIVNR